MSDFVFVNNVGGEADFWTILNSLAQVTMAVCAIYVIKEGPKIYRSQKEIDRFELKKDNLINKLISLNFEIEGVHRKAKKTLNVINSKGSSNKGNLVFKNYEEINNIIINNVEEIYINIHTFVYVYFPEEKNVLNLYKDLIKKTEVLKKFDNGEGGFEDVFKKLNDMDYKGMLDKIKAIISEIEKLKYKK